MSRSNQKALLPVRFLPYLVVFISSMGIMIINFNPRGEAIFQIMERYTEELIFIIFFTLSGMYLNILVLGDYWMLVLAFVVFRSLGKISGTLLGAHVAG